MLHAKLMPRLWRIALIGMVLVIGHGKVFTASVLGDNPENSVPVYSALGVAPKVLLTMSRDHTLANAAYNDFSDIDGDSVIDYKFKPNFEYIGLYNSYYCYSYTSPVDQKTSYTADISPQTAAYTTYTPPTKNPGYYANADQGYFSPVASNVATKEASGKTVLGPCDNSGTTKTWSGNFLNYVTTSRIDALRVALYGGYRETDTATETLLRRAYIPQDGHGWAKEYKDIATDGYDIRDYTDLDLPTANHYHFFGNLTSTVKDGVYNNGDQVYDNDIKYPDPGVNCTTLDTCSQYPPLMRVILNSPVRVWVWASSARPVLNFEANPPQVSWATRNSFKAGTLKDFHVRVKACIASYRDGCKQYGSSYKPVGVLQTFGDDERIDFGLLTGSYDNNMSGGRLRKRIGPFTDEVASTNGTFLRPTNSIVTQIDKIRIRNFNNDANLPKIREPSYYDWNFLYKNKWDEAYTKMSEGFYGDWGNPVAEMMYEGLRYLSNQTSATPSYTDKKTSEDTAVGLGAPSWTDSSGKPLYTETNWCAKPSQYVISSVEPSFDSDALPGSDFGSLDNPLIRLDGTAINVKSFTDTIGKSEALEGKYIYIGVSGTADNGNPTLKQVNRFGSIRGLMPTDTKKEGSYYAAGVANYGKQGEILNVVGNVVSNTVAPVDTYAILLNSPVPRIAVGGITFIPYSQTIGTTSGENKTYDFTPTNQYVGIYINSITTSTKNGISTTEAIDFLVNYEDASWGGNHDMDVLVRYNIVKNSDSTVTIKVYDESQSGSSIIRSGYIVVNSTDDGAKLVVQDQSFTKADPQLPYRSSYTRSPSASEISTQTFIPSGSANTAFLKDPLWYAVKWGSYPDGSPPSGPTTVDPEGYAKVTSPASVKQAFSAAFNSILQRANQSSGVSATTQQLQTDTQVFTASFRDRYYTGDVLARKINQTTAIDGTGLHFDDQWRASANMPAVNDRQIFDYYLGFRPLVPPRRAFLDDDQLAYLRGDRKLEQQYGGSYRNRDGDIASGKGVLGAIINSSPVYSDDTKMVYVAANDGMLHAFGANDGIEKFAYIPNAVKAYISNVMLTSSSRRFYLDGNIAVSSKDSSGVNYVVGFFGRAAKGVYGLGVNAKLGAGQTGIATNVTPWEITATNDPYMGNVLGKAVIDRISDGTEVLIFGNGYNSTNNQPTLYVVKVSDGTVLAKYPVSVTTSTTANGLATPGIARDGKTGRVTYAYAGDYLGQIWKFDLTTLTASSRPPATLFATGTKIFVAQDSSATPMPQPITAPITVGSSYDGTDPYVKNKLFLFFGTGSDLTSADATSKVQQSLYGIIDSGSGSPLANNRGLNGLLQRNFDPGIGKYSGYHGAGGIVYARSIPNSKSEATDMKDYVGWVLDWPAGIAGTPAEKVVSAPLLRHSNPPALVVSSFIPNVKSCSSASKGWVTFVDAYHGDGFVQSYIDLNRDNSFDEKVNEKVISSVDFGIGIVGGASALGDQFFVSGTEGRTGDLNTSVGSKDGDGKFGTLSVRKGRVSWREIVK